MKAKLKYNFILVSALITLLILILYFICKLRPTFDDWTYITTPDNGKDICRNILPFWSYWRPFDAILGLILSWYHSLFPYLNHIIIFIYHIGCTIFIYKTGKKIGYNNIVDLRPIIMNMPKYILPYFNCIFKSKSIYSYKISICWNSSVGRAAHS